MGEMQTSTRINFDDTAIAFKYKSDSELKKTALWFKLMNYGTLVNVASRLAMFALKCNLPFMEQIVKSTIFDLFVGGISLTNCQPQIDALYKFNIQCILDYGAEAKKTEEDFDRTMDETIRAIEFGTKNESVPAVSTKITGLGRFAVLEKVQNGDVLNTQEQKQRENLNHRIDRVCQAAYEGNVAILVDAEESWIQDPIDEIVREMMNRYNKSRVVVYNTYQMYRWDRLGLLKSDHKMALANGFKIGAKLVRGAYMDKERMRAKEMGYRSPIQKNKNATDEAFNQALDYCLDHYQTIAFCNATHNRASTEYLAGRIEEANISNNHPHLNFCQLFGMSDNLTFNLSKRGYHVAKYLPYGPIKDVIPYLIRRIKENSTVTGDMSREYKLLLKEIREGA